ncbi:hypothetical protein LTR85_003662 [Meristemomyces frigidus]|nr:hypothetical protein LTR85_003662 [Meristemomyces frigidus]
MDFFEAHPSTILAGTSIVDPFKAYRNAIKRFPNDIESLVICAIPENKQRRYDFDVTSVLKAVLLETTCGWLLTELVNEYKVHGVSDATTKCEGEMILFRELLKRKPRLSDADFVALMKWRDDNIAAAPKGLDVKKMPVCLSKAQSAHRAMIAKAAADRKFHLDLALARIRGDLVVLNDDADASDDPVVTHAAPVRAGQTRGQLVNPSDEADALENPVVTHAAPVQAGLTRTAPATLAPSMEYLSAVDAMHLAGSAPGMDALGGLDTGWNVHSPPIPSLSDMRPPPLLRMGNDCGLPGTSGHYLGARHCQAVPHLPAAYQYGPSSHASSYADPIICAIAANIQSIRFVASYNRSARHMVRPYDSHFYDATASTGTDATAR